MNKVLVLNGNNNVGKSNTLYKLIYLFPSKDIRIIKEHKLYKNCGRGTPELSAYIKYKNKRICIITKGDNLKIVLDEIKLFTREGINVFNCDLFVCASHNSGKLVKFLLQKYDRKIFISKEKNKRSYAKENLKKAKCLKKIIDNLLLSNI